MRIRIPAPTFDRGIRGFPVRDPNRHFPDGPVMATRYSQLVNTVIEFLIIALTVFVVVRITNRIIRTREAADN